MNLSEDFLGDYAATRKGQKATMEPDIKSIHEQTLAQVNERWGSRRYSLRGMKGVNGYWRTCARAQRVVGGKESA